MKKHFRFATVLGMAALAAVGAFLYTTSDRTPAQNGPDEPGQSDGKLARKAPASPDGDLRTAIEKRGLQYAVSFEVSLDGDEAFLAGSGKLNLQEVEVDAQGSRWVGILGDVASAVDLPGATGNAADGLAKELSTPFAFTLSPKGEVTSIGFRDAGTFKGQSIARALVAALQFVGGDSGSATWEGEETDSLGRCKVRYQRTAPDQFAKTKPECPFLLATSVSGVKLTGKVDSTSHYELDGRRVVQKVVSNEALAITFPQGGSATTAAKLDLSLYGEVAGANPFPEFKSWKMGPLYGEARKAKALTPAEQLEHHKVLLGGATFADVSRDLDAAISADDSSSRTLGFAKMSALFQVEPNSIKNAAEQLRGDIETSKAEALVAALADSRSAAAQAEMNALVRDPNVQDHVKGHVLTHMSLHEEPSIETFDTLEDVALHGEDPEMKDQATLALGGAARHGEASEETREVATRTTDSLNKAYDEAQSPEQRRMILSALGNAGAASSIPVIERSLQDEDPETRADAVFSLRFVVGEKAEQLIAHVLLDDPVSGVRRAAVAAYGYRDLSPVLEQAALQSYESEEALDVRSALVSVLVGKMPEVGPQVLQVIQLATRDANEDIQTIATDALAPEPQQQTAP